MSCLATAGLVSFSLLLFYCLGFRLVSKFVKLSLFKSMDEVLSWPAGESSSLIVVTVVTSCKFNESGSSQSY